MNKSEIATSAQLLQLVAKFAQVLPIDASREEVQKVIENRDDPLWVAVKDRFAQVVEEVKSVLQDMITLGHYSSVKADINEKNFNPDTLVLGEGAKLFHFDRNITSADAIIEMDKAGFKPASLGDLLDFGAKNPEK